MKAFTLAIVWGVAMVGACSLNPQPLPPLTADDASLAADVMSAPPEDSGTTFGDAAGSAPDAGVDGAVKGDAGAADAMVDAESDASDASDDATTDADASDE